MKKILVLTMFMSLAAFAQTTLKSWPYTESASCVTLSGGVVECMQKGYICDLSVDVLDARSNTFAFYLSLDPSCSDPAKFFTSTVFPTEFVLRQLDAEPVIQPSKYTKFCLINDDNYAGAQSMTLIGSVMLSAYNNSTLVAVSYRRGPKDGDGLYNEYGGVRVKNITLVKPSEKHL